MKALSRLLNLFTKKSKQDLKFTDLIYIKRGFLSKEQCELLIKECEQRSDQAIYEHSTNAITGQAERSTFKCVELKAPSANFSAIHSATKQMIQEWIPYLESFNAFNIAVFKHLLNYSHSHRVLKYQVGSKIHPHTDWHHLTFASCTINLNEDYEGGELVFFNGLHSIKLGRGDAVIWPADCFWVHEVKPVTRGVRYCSNSFILARSSHHATYLRDQIHKAPMELTEHRYFDDDKINPVI